MPLPPSSPDGGPPSSPVGEPLLPAPLEPPLDPPRELPPASPELEPPPCGPPKTGGPLELAHAPSAATAATMPARAMTRFPVRFGMLAAAVAAGREIRLRDGRADFLTGLTRRCHCAGDEARIPSATPAFGAVRLRPGCVRLLSCVRAWRVGGRRRRRNRNRNGVRFERRRWPVQGFLLELWVVGRVLWRDLRIQWERGSGVELRIQGPGASSSSGFGLRVRRWRIVGEEVRRQHLDQRRHSFGLLPPVLESVHPGGTRASGARSRGPREPSTGARSTPSTSTRQSRGIL